MLKSSIWPLRGLSGKYRPFWIFREPVTWPWCNLPASQRRHYCASVNSHSPVGLVSRQWDAVNWVCVLCDRPIHSDRASRSASSRQCSCPFYSSRAGFFFDKASHHPGLSAPLHPILGSLRLLAFSKSKIAVERRRFVGHTVHKVSQLRLTADWLTSRDSDSSQMSSKVSSDWLPSYIKATRPVLEIFKMAGYFPDCPSILNLYYVCYNVVSLLIQYTRCYVRTGRPERLSDSQNEDKQWQCKKRFHQDYSQPVSAVRFR